MLLRKVKRMLPATSAAALLLGAADAMAEYGLNLPQGVKPISREAYDLHMLIFWVCVAIGVVVIGIIDQGSEIVDQTQAAIDQTRDWLAEHRRRARPIAVGRRFRVDPRDPEAAPTAAPVSRAMTPRKSQARQRAVTANATSASWKARSWRISSASPERSSANARARASMGSSPGWQTTARHPGGARATTPARTNELLPAPEGPTTASSRRPAIFRHRAAISVSRPKKTSASSSVNGSRPG